MRVMMVGATGRNAHLVLQALVQRGVLVRALVRSEQSAQVARDNGAAETVIGDLNDPESLDVAAVGMEGVFHIGPAFAPTESAMGLAMVAAARQAGVRKFVYSGVIHPAITDMVNHAAKLPVEDALYSSGLDYTVLQPAVFMQGLGARNWPEMVATGRLSLPYSVTSKLCWVDYREVAEVAALAMTTTELSYGTFELSSAGMYDGTQIAAIASAVLGRPVETVEVAPDGLAPGPVGDGIRRMIAHYDRCGLPGGNPLVLRTLLGREPRTLEEYLRELAGSHA